MKLIVSLLSLCTLLSICSCASADENAKGNSAGATDTSKSGFYFTYTIDGKKIDVPQDAISTSMNEFNGVQIFKIFAGNYGETSLVLTIPNGAGAASVTPSGSTDKKLDILQGSISLQGYPEKGYTTNSFDYMYPDKTPVKADAITITSSEKEGEVARIISGKFSATTYGDFSGTDPKSTNHVVEGSFRIRHEFTGNNGGKF